MKILIIYDSVFGNTEKIAQAIGNALSAQDYVRVSRVNEVEPGQLADLDLLLVGSPTRAFRPTAGITQFLKSLAKQSLKGIKVAAFDTRIALQDIKSPVFRAIVKTGGYAATAIAKKLIRKGGSQVMLPEGFIVKGAEGPLKEGEPERAAQWIKLFNQS